MGCAHHHLHQPLGQQHRAQYPGGDVGHTVHQVGQQHGAEEGGQHTRRQENFPAPGQRISAKKNQRKSEHVSAVLPPRSARRDPGLISIHVNNAKSTTPCQEPGHHSAKPPDCGRKKAPQQGVAGRLGPCRPDRSAAVVGRRLGGRLCGHGRGRRFGAVSAAVAGANHIAFDCHAAAHAGGTRHFDHDAVNRLPCARRPGRRFPCAYGLQLRCRQSRRRPRPEWWPRCGRRHGRSGCRARPPARHRPRCRYQHLPALVERSIGVTDSIAPHTWQTARRRPVRDKVRAPGDTPA
jgi:hypothetical protein